VFEDHQLPQIFALLARIAKAVVATVGSNCEVVIHDLRNPEHSVVAISGNLTGRSIGAPVPDPEMLPENVVRFSDDDLCYNTRTPSGKQFFSSTVWVRDVTGHIVGALCINMDFSNIQQARDLLDRLLMSSEGPSSHRELETFATSPEDFILIALRDAIKELGKPIHHLERQDKVYLVKTLDKAGVFSFRQAVDIISQELGISRSSLYNYLKDVRNL
jgi:predicted transcriptional regulator YheO